MNSTDNSLRESLAGYINYGYGMAVRTGYQVCWYIDSNINLRFKLIHIENDSGSVRYQVMRHMPTGIIAIDIRRILKIINIHCSGRSYMPVRRYPTLIHLSNSLIQGNLLTLADGETCAELVIAPQELHKFISLIGYDEDAVYTQSISFRSDFSNYDGKHISETLWKDIRIGEEVQRIKEDANITINGENIYSYYVDTQKYPDSIQSRRLIRKLNSENNTNVTHNVEIHYSNVCRSLVYFLYHNSEKSALLTSVNYSMYIDEKLALILANFIKEQGNREIQSEDVIRYQINYRELIEAINNGELQLFKWRKDPNIYDEYKLIASAAEHSIATNYAQDYLSDVVNFVREGEYVHIDILINQLKSTKKDIVKWLKSIGNKEFNRIINEVVEADYVSRMDPKVEYGNIPFDYFELGAITIRQEKYIHCVLQLKKLNKKHNNRSNRG